MSAESAYKRVESLNNELYLAYQDARILDADHLVRELEAIMFVLPKNDSDELKQLRKAYVAKKVLYDKIKQEAEEVRSVVTYFRETQTDWATTVDDGKGNTCSYKQHPNTTVYTFRLDAVIPQPLEKLMPVCLEVDLYNEWVPTIMGFGLKNINLLRSPDWYHKVAHTEIALPWPISNRDAVLVATGCDLLDQNAIVIAAHGTDQDSLFPVPQSVDYAQWPETADLAGPAPDAEAAAAIAETSSKKAVTLTGTQLPTPDQYIDILRSVPALVPAKKGSIVRAKVPKGGFMIVPVDENSSKISFVASMDPDMSLPGFLINIALKHFAFLTVGNVEAAAAKVGTPKSKHTLRVTDQPHIYETLRNRLAAEKNWSPEEKEARKQASIAKLTTPRPLNLADDDAASPTAQDSSPPEASSASPIVVATSE